MKYKILSAVEVFCDGILKSAINSTSPRTLAAKTKNKKTVAHKGKILKCFLVKILFYFFFQMK